MIPRVPYDAEVEYIESNHTSQSNQAIDTLVYPSGSVGSKIVFEPLEMQDKTIMMAGGDPYGGWRWGFSSASTNYQLQVANLNTYQFYNYAMGTGAHEVSYNFDGKRNCYLDGTFLRELTYSDTARDTTIHINAVIGPTGNLWRPHRMRIYSCQMSDGGVVIRDFIPVRFTNELGISEGAMYDRVSKKLFRNQGTGAFIIGPDVATPVIGLRFFKPEEYVAKSYVQDGLVAMWDGIENVGFRKHSYATETWKDLTGNGNDTTIVKSESYSRSAPFDATAARMDGTFSFSFTPSQELISALQGSCTVEIVAILGVPTLVDNVPYIGLGPYNTSIMCIAGMASSLKARPYINNEVQCYGAGTNAPFRQRAFVKEMDGSSAVCTWYKRGAFDKQESRTFQTATVTVGNLFGNSANFFGGKGRYWDSGEDGYAYGIRVYNRALTQSELAANYEIDKARFNLP